jgi:hypothetical protein
MRRRALVLLVAALAAGALALGTTAATAGATVGSKSHHGVVEKKKKKKKATAKCDQAAIKDAWNIVLNGQQNAPLTDKEAHVQYIDSSAAFKAQFEAQQAATASLAGGTTPVINKITCAKNGKSASVDFDLSFNGTVIDTIVTAPGKAVLENGVWKMAAETMCNLQATGDPNIIASGPCSQVINGEKPS